MKTSNARIALILTALISAVTGKGAPIPTEKEKGGRLYTHAESEMIHSNGVFAVALSEMVQTTNSFRDLSAMAASCKRDISLQTNRAVLISLVSGIRSRTPVAFVDSSMLEVPSRIRSGKMRKSAKTTVIRQDVFLKGGRAAWFLEQILNCELPELTEQTTDEELEDMVLEAYYQVQEAMLPPGSLRTVSGLSLVEKRSLAESPDANPVIFYKLSKDSDNSIRTAIAANKRAPGHVLARLKRDKDEAIRKLAQENLRHARLRFE